jgi:hypothetical protein
MGEHVRWHEVALGLALAVAMVLLLRRIGM